MNDIEQEEYVSLHNLLAVFMTNSQIKAETVSSVQYCVVAVNMSSTLYHNREGQYIDCKL